MSNALLFKNYTAAMAIPAYRILKFSALDTVTLATAATDSLMGVNSDVAPAIGERCDAVRQGIAFVEAGAAIAQGAPITSDATGRGVTAAPAAGVNNRIIGFADEAAAAAGDVIRVLVELGVMQG
jgi:hypothetical protein